MSRPFGQSSSLNSAERRSARQAAYAQGGFGSQEFGTLQVQLSATAGEFKGEGCCSNLMIHPEKNSICWHWDKTVILALLFTCTVTPFEVGFLGDVSISELFIVNRVIDSIFVLDMCLQFFLQYSVSTKRGTQWVSNSRLIAMRYLRGWFCIDLISILPLDMIGYILADGEPQSGLNATSSTQRSSDEDVSTLRAVKVIRCLRLLKLARVLRASRIVQRWQSKFNLSMRKRQFIKFGFSLTISAHWFGCAWGLAGSLQDEGGPNWLEGEGTEPLARWVASLHWSAQTLTSIGYGDIVPVTTSERIFVTFAMLAAGFLWAIVIANFSAVASRVNERLYAFRRTMDELNQVMEAFRLEKSTKRKLRNFFHWKHDSGSLPQRLVTLCNDLPLLLNQELLMSVHGQWVRKMSIINDCCIDFKAELCRELELRLGQPQEAFGRPWTLYVAFSGIVHRVARMMLVCKGSIWGEDFLLNDPSLLENPRCVSLNFSEVLYLRRQSLEDVRSRFPYDSKLVRRATARLVAQRGIWRYVISCAGSHGGTGDQKEGNPILQKRGMLFIDLSTMRRTPSFLREQKMDQLEEQRQESEGILRSSSKESVVRSSSKESLVPFGRQSLNKFQSVTPANFFATLPKKEKRTPSPTVNRHGKDEETSRGISKQRSKEEQQILDELGMTQEHSPTVTKKGELTVLQKLNERLEGIEAELTSRRLRLASLVKVVCPRPGSGQVNGNLAGDDLGQAELSRIDIATSALLDGLTF